MNNFKLADHASNEGTPNREQRNALRLVLNPGEASFDTGSLGGVELYDVSVSGVGLVLPRDFDQHHRELGGVLRLGDREARVRLEPTRTAMNSDFVRVGARFLDPTHETMKDLGDFLIQGFVKRDRSLAHLDRSHTRTLRFRKAQLITELLRDRLIRRHLPLSVFRGSELLPGRLLANEFHKVSETLQIAVTTISGPHGLSDGEVYTFVTPDTMSVTRFTSRIRCISENTALIECPSELEQCGFREYVRKPLSNGEELLVRAAHPRVRGALLHRRASDVSAAGFLFSVTRETGLILPGDAMRNVTLQLPYGKVLVDAQVRHVAPSPDDEDGVDCGIEITAFQTDADRERWERFVLEKTHARVSYNEPGLEKAAWDVLVSSGYLDLWTVQEDRDRLANGYHDSWRAASPNVGRLLVLSENPKNIGTFAISRLYPRTWLVHSFGVDKNEMGKIRHFVEIARDLYSALIYSLQTAPDARYFACYFERDQRWGDVLYGDFVAACSDGDASLYDDFRLFKWHYNSSGIKLVPEDSCIEVKSATASDLSVLSAHLQGALTPLEYDAFSYSADEIDLSRFEEMCAQQGCTRRRDVFMARENGNVAAALIAESGSEGESIFGLLDRCWIVWWPSCTLRESTKSHLLAAAVRHYSLLEKREAIFLDTDDVAFSDTVGFHFVSDGRRWLVGRDLMSAWRTFVDEVLRARIR